MKIISVEGLDKSGKRTISMYIAELLRVQGYTVVITSFPRYDTPTGELIRKWLTKEWDVDQATMDLIAAADRQAQQAFLKDLEDSGNCDFVVIDRYLTSQVSYGTSGGLDQSWVESLHKYMRKPDIEFYLDIPAEVSMERVGKHNNGINDRYEENKEFLEKVRHQYISMVRMDAFIDATRDIEDVKENVKYALNELLEEVTV